MEEKVIGYFQEFDSCFAEQDEDVIKMMEYCSIN